MIPCTWFCKYQFQFFINSESLYSMYNFVTAVEFFCATLASTYITLQYILKVLPLDYVLNPRKLLDIILGDCS